MAGAGPECREARSAGPGRCALPPGLPLPPGRHASNNAERGVLPLGRHASDDAAQGVLPAYPPALLSPPPGGPSRCVRP